MLTKIAKQLIVASAVSNINSAYYKGRLTNGDIMYFTIGRSSSKDGYPTYRFSTAIASSNITNGFVFGNGTTAPTENDYALESYIPTSSLAKSLVNQEIVFDGDEPTASLFRFVLTNNTASDITVSEVGLQQQCICATTKGGNLSYYYFLMDRTLLDEPVTIPPSETVTVDYVFNLPTLS